MLRPSLVGRDAIARSLNAPVLAELSTAPESWGNADFAEAAMHIQLATVAAGVSKVELMALARHVDVRALTRLLDKALGTVAVRLGVDPRGRARGSDGLRADEGQLGHAGLVLVTPHVVKMSDLNKALDFVAFSGWPLLGLIVFRSRPTRPPFPRLRLPHGSRLGDEAPEDAELAR
jgi:hypothetical protein